MQTKLATHTIMLLSHLQRLNAGWNSVYRRIFGFNKWNSVKSFIHGLGFLDLKHIFMLRKAKFFLEIA